MVVLVGTIGMAILSRQLDPALPPASRPLLHCAFLYGIAFVGYVIGCRLVWGHAPRAPLAWIVAVGVIARLAFLPSALIQSDDAYRYVLDGQAVRAGINPFAHAPAELQTEPPQWILDGGDRALAVLDLVNHPDVPTIYPPLAQLSFAAGAVISPWRIIGPRLVFTAIELGVLALVIVLLRVIQRPLGWCLLQAWNPLVIKEIANSAHVDVLPALFILLLVPLLADLRPERKQRRPWLAPAVAGLVLGLATLAKLYPLVIAPLCAVALARGRRPVANCVNFLLATGATIAVGYLPVLDVGLEQLTAGLKTYSDHWINNPGAFVIFDWLFDSSRAVVAIIPMFIALLCGLALPRERTPAAVAAMLQVVLVVWLLLLPACFPWYAVPLVVLGTLRPTVWLIVLTGAFGLFYVALFAEYQGAAAWAARIRAIEHIIIWGWLAWSGFAALFAIKPAQG